MLLPLALKLEVDPKPAELDPDELLGVGALDGDSGKENGDYGGVSSGLRHLNVAQNDDIGWPSCL